MPERKVQDVNTITIEVHISEDEIREMLMQHFLREEGLLDSQGDLAPGVQTNIRRGSGTQGGYTMTARRDRNATKQITQEKE